MSNPDKTRQIPSQVELKRMRVFLVTLEHWRTHVNRLGAIPSCWGAWQCWPWSRCPNCKSRKLHKQLRDRARADWEAVVSKISKETLVWRVYLGQLKEPV